VIGHSTCQGVCRFIDDRPNEAGWTLYQLIFGRDRIGDGLPITIAHAAEDAIEWWNKCREVEEQVYLALDALRKKEEESQHRFDRGGEHYSVGSKVWILRPRPLGANKVLTWWTGPHKVLQQVGERTYTIDMGGNQKRDCHTSQMKLHQPPMDGPEWPMHYTKGEVAEEEQDPDDFDVESIIRHRRGKKGELEFLVRWEGYGEEEDTWEPQAVLCRRCVDHGWSIARGMI